jgi:F0F1-type ATP synthase assembly protein I
MSERLPDRKEMSRLYAIAQIGMEMVAPIGVGLAIDYYFDWLPWATAVCAVMGFIGGMVHLVMLVQQYDAEERRPPPGDAPQ